MKTIRLILLSCIGIAYEGTNDDKLRSFAQAPLPKALYTEPDIPEASFHQIVGELLRIVPEGHKKELGEILGNPALTYVSWHKVFNIIFNSQETNDMMKLKKKFYELIRFDFFFKGANLGERLKLLKRFGLEKGYIPTPATNTEILKSFLDKSPDRDPEGTIRCDLREFAKEKPIPPSSIAFLGRCMEIMIGNHRHGDNCFEDPGMYLAMRIFQAMETRNRELLFQIRFEMDNPNMIPTIEKNSFLHPSVIQLQIIDKLESFCQGGNQGKIATEFKLYWGKAIAMYTEMKTSYKKAMEILLKAEEQGYITEFQWKQVCISLLQIPDGIKEGNEAVILGRLVNLTAGVRKDLVDLNKFQEDILKQRKGMSEISPEGIANMGEDLYCRFIFSQLYAPVKCLEGFDLKKKAFELYLNLLGLILREDSVSTQNLEKAPISDFIGNTKGLIDLQKQLEQLIEQGLISPLPESQARLLDRNRENLQVSLDYLNQIAQLEEKIGDFDDIGMKKIIQIIQDISEKISVDQKVPQATLVLNRLFFMVSKDAIKKSVASGKDEILSANQQVLSMIYDLRDKLKPKTIDAPSLDESEEKQETDVRVTEGEEVNKIALQTEEVPETGAAEEVPVLEDANSTKDIESSHPVEEERETVVCPKPKAKKKHKKHKKLDPNHQPQAVAEIGKTEEASASEHESSQKDIESLHPVEEKRETVVCPKPKAKKKHKKHKKASASEHESSQKDIESSHPVEETCVAEGEEVNKIAPQTEEVPETGPAEEAPVSEDVAPEEATESTPSPRPKVNSAYIARCVLEEFYKKVQAPKSSEYPSLPSVHRNFESITAALREATFSALHYYEKVEPAGSIKAILEKCKTIILTGSQTHVKDFMALTKNGGHVVMGSANYSYEWQDGYKKYDTMLELKESYYALSLALAGLVVVLCRSATHTADATKKRGYIDHLCNLIDKFIDAIIVEHTDTAITDVKKFIRRNIVNKLSQDCGVEQYKKDVIADRVASFIKEAVLDVLPDSKTTKVIMHWLNPDGVQSSNEMECLNMPTLDDFQKLKLNKNDSILWFGHLAPTRTAEQGYVGYRTGSELLKVLISYMKDAKSIYFTSVSAPVKELRELLKGHNVKIEVKGSYEGHEKEILDWIEGQQQCPGQHSKCVFIETKDGELVVLVGSANLGLASLGLLGDCDKNNFESVALIRTRKKELIDALKSKHVQWYNSIKQLKAVESC